VSKKNMKLRGIRVMIVRILMILNYIFWVDGDVMLQNTRFFLR
jgi:hypothetical protein